MVPKALRRRDSTITILVNDVRRMRIAGARESTVKRRKICKTTATSSGFPALSKPMFMKGRDGTAPAPQQTWPLKQTKRRVIPETVNNLRGLIKILLHLAMIKFVPGLILQGRHPRYLISFVLIASVTDSKMNPRSSRLQVR